jgi:hypothetical protein
MGRVVRGCLAAVFLTGASPIGLAQLDAITQREAAAGLRAALEQGARAAVATLGRADGFLGNPAVRIPLPESAQRAEKLARRMGLGRKADELIVAMNRAAEQAVPEARALLVDSVKKMSAKDAKAILRGGDTAATDYFRRATTQPLHERFLPIVKRATAKTRVAQHYNEFAGSAAALGLIKTEHADLDEYVTQKALGALYLMLAEEEKKIRDNPRKAASAVIRKVFGAL